MASAIRCVEKGVCRMSITLEVKQTNAEKLASCIQNIAGIVSANDIVEIVLKGPAKKVDEAIEKEDATMTSREVADILGRPHTSVVKQIAKFLCAEKKEGVECGFILTSFVCSHRNKKSYPMYEMTEKGCKIYRNLVAEYGAGIKSVVDGLRRFDRAIKERFHPDKAMIEISKVSESGFLLEGKPRSEYEEYCNIFNQFIMGPAAEGREIAELTEKYEQFYKVMKSAQLKTKESNELEIALWGVAIEAEMQGFIYGFKMLNALLNKQLTMA